MLWQVLRFFSEIRLIKSGKPWYKCASKFYSQFSTSEKTFLVSLTRVEKMWKIKNMFNHSSFIIKLCVRKPGGLFIWIKFSYYRSYAYRFLLIYFRSINLGLLFFFWGGRHMLSTGQNRYKTGLANAEMSFYAFKSIIRPTLYHTWTA